MGALVVIEILIFLAILAVGLAYCWSKGDLDWVKSFREKNGGVVERGGD